MDKYLLPEDDGLPIRTFGKWTKQKLHYLQKYIYMFETSMRQMKWCARCYVDLFAGRGKYRVEDQKDILLGSPLIALTTKHPFTHYFFADTVQEHIDILKQRCTLISSINKQFYVGDANKVVSNIVAEIKAIERNRPEGSWSSLNLAFLDPDGLELEWRTIATLAKVKRMDLIIHYSQSGLTRNFENCINTDGETIIDRFFGDFEWRRIYEQCKLGDPIQIHRRLMDYYMSKLSDLGYLDVKDVEDYEGSEPLMRNTRQAPLYRLLFASKHKRGHDFWKEVVRRDVTGQTKFW
ncbi:MAG: three-Cys-motif partner protein TcmP [Chloroflexota bacterium]